MSITVRLLEESDIKPITSAFAIIGDAHELPSLYYRYLEEQDRDERTVLVAWSEQLFAGYVTILWLADYPPFAEEGIPLIQDLIVLPAFRKKKIGTRLMDEAEKRISERSQLVGLGVGMYSDYGPAQRMYPLRGYVPDGRGLFHKNRAVVPGEDVHVDDDLVLFMVKKL